VMVLNTNAAHLVQQPVISVS